jgi:hypothetical protein
MSGAGLVIINPPWQLDERLKVLMPQLHKLLSPEGLGGSNVEYRAGVARPSSACCGRRPECGRRGVRQRRSTPTSILLSDSPEGRASSTAAEPRSCAAPG